MDLSVSGRIFSNYDLGFLDSLVQQLCENTVQKLWVNRTFPLVLLGDFSRNWFKVRDESGIFHDESGHFYHIEPQDHHLSQLQAIITDCETVSDIYEAVVFAKIIHQIFLNRLEPEGILPQLRRRSLVNEFKKLPRKWSVIAIRHDLHLYNETGDLGAPNTKCTVYSALAKDDNIRILHLLPATDDSAPIECKLQEVERHPDLVYEALSYTWGPPVPRRNITLDGQTFSVTKNLAAALRDLRQRNSRRVLWVDAVCIDQSNIQERGSQVAQMNLIYINATRVLVWLGRESSTSSAIFNGFKESIKFLKLLISHAPESRFFPFMPVDHCAECENYTLTRRAWNGVGDDFALDDVTNLSEAFVQLLQRPWWKRVWVLQEFVLAKEVMFFCGSRSIEWKYLQTNLNVLARQARRAAKHQEGGLGRRVRTNHQLLELLNETFPFFLLQQSSDQPTKALPTLENLLAISSGFDATDCRDKIFALLGVLSDDKREALGITPRYDLKPRQTFVELAKAFIMSTRRLDVLTARPHLPKKHREDLVLPSWVPDLLEGKYSYVFNSISATQFSSYGALQNFMSNQVDRQEDQPSEFQDKATGRLFNAGLEDALGSSLFFAENNEVLRVRGVTVDSIAFVGSSLNLGRAALAHYAPGDQSIERLNRIHLDQLAIIQGWKRLCLAMSASTYLPTGGPILEAFWRTVVLDRFITHGENGHSMARLPDVINKDNAGRLFGWSDALKFPPADHDQESTMLMYMRTITLELWNFNKLNPYCVNLRFFTTSRGYIGIGHPSCAPGDKVTVLLGSSVPLVLREFPEGHVLIGER